MLKRNEAAVAARERAEGSESARIFATVSFTFICYLTVGLPLAVIPPFVHDRLGYGAVLAGLSISVQYAATVLSRSQVGQMADTLGAKLTVLRGLVACGVAGILVLVAALAVEIHGASLGFLLASRLALGVGESLVGTGAIAWAIGSVGSHQTARVISWNGIATYGALALGAPLGVLLAAHFGFESVGIVTILLGVLGFALARRRVPSPILEEKKLDFRAVLGRVTPYGTVLALGATGFGVIGSFITLFYRSRDWSGAAFSLSMFGLFFVAARVLFANSINRYGGFRVAILSLSVECLGLVTLWYAASPVAAMVGAALTGFGFALVFPSLGVVAIGRVPPQNRGAAIGVYSVFADIALGITGPVAGFAAGHFTYAAPFMFGAIATALGVTLTMGLYLRERMA